MRVSVKQKLARDAHAEATAQTTLQLARVSG
jgi:hypothetical protein